MIRNIFNRMSMKKKRHSFNLIRKSSPRTPRREKTMEMIVKSLTFWSDTRWNVNIVCQWIFRIIYTPINVSWAEPDNDLTNVWRRSQSIWRSSFEALKRRWWQVRQQQNYERGINRTTCARRCRLDRSYKPINVYRAINANAFVPIAVRRVISGTRASSSRWATLSVYLTQIG